MDKTKTRTTLDGVRPALNAHLQSPALMRILDAMSSDIAQLREEVERLKLCGQSYGEECAVCTRPRGHSGGHG